MAKHQCCSSPGSEDVPGEGIEAVNRPTLTGTNNSGGPTHQEFTCFPQNAAVLSIFRLLPARPGF
jgi:hypothetical protein